MKVINLEFGFLAYQKIFSNLQANYCPLVVWQNDPDLGRQITDSHINSFHVDSKVLQLDLEDDFEMDREMPLYCYSEDSQIIFKTTINEIKGKIYTVELPVEIQYLEDDERDEIKKKIGRDLNSDYMKVKRLDLGIANIPDMGGFMRVKSMAQRSSRDQEFLTGEFSGTVDEEDKMFEGQRESPRARPKKEKWVKMRLSNSETVHRLKLFDLSQGGMSFVTFDVDFFPKGSEIQLVGVDVHELDDPLFGKIVSLRPIAEDQTDWKIGVKFDPGQD